MNKFFLIILFITLTGCQSEKDKNLINDCDGLAMMYYRGLPHPSKLYVEHCQSKESQLEYTPKRCQKAMGQLMMRGSQEELKKLFGTRIMECFNEADKKKFLIK